jgi:hypothetical protein
MSHFVKTTLYFFAATLITLGFGLGASFSAGMILPGLLVSLLVAAPATFSAVFLTMKARSSFSLMQTGRFVQYASFWATGAIALKIVSLIFASVIVVSNLALASFSAMAICMISATLFGQIPWKGRTWLPVRFKSKK